MRGKITKLIRELAKSGYFQGVYQSAEKVRLRIFENDMDLTFLQMEFLGFLSFYSNLYLDLALGDVDEMVFEDEIYEDAYNYFKREEMKNREKPTKKGMKDRGEIHTWIFKSKPKVN